LAIADYTAALQIAPEDKQLLNDRGYEYRKIKDYHRAFDDFDLALKLKPDYLNPLVNRGHTYADPLEYDLADGYVLGANEYDIKGDWDKAIANYMSVLLSTNRTTLWPTPTEVVCMRLGAKLSRCSRTITGL